MKFKKGDKVLVLDVNKISNASFNPFRLIVKPEVEKVVGQIRTIEATKLNWEYQGHIDQLYKLEGVEAWLDEEWLKKPDFKEVINCLK